MLPFDGVAVVVVVGGAGRGGWVIVDVVTVVAVMWTAVEMEEEEAGVRNLLDA
jgi:hypothetical protein